MEFIFQLLFEFFAQLLLEGIVDVACGRAGETRPTLRFFLFLLLGTIIGFFSLLVTSAHVITLPTLRYTAAIVVPVLIGLLMAWIGRLRARRGSPPNSLEHFSASWAFAFAFGAVRVVFAR